MRRGEIAKESVTRAKSVAKRQHRAVLLLTRQSKKVPGIGVSVPLQLRAETIQKHKDAAP
jgi:hypothetical protein